MNACFLLVFSNVKVRQMWERFNSRGRAPARAPRFPRHTHVSGSERRPSPRRAWTRATRAQRPAHHLAPPARASEALLPARRALWWRPQAERMLQRQQQQHQPQRQRWWQGAAAEVTAPPRREDDSATASAVPTRRSFQSYCAHRPRRRHRRRHQCCCSANSKRGQRRRRHCCRPRPHPRGPGGLRWKRTRLPCRARQKSPCSAPAARTRPG